MCGVEMTKDEFMKTRNLQTVLAVMAVKGMAFSATTMLAQDSTATSTVQPAAVNASAPQLAYGASQILQLAQSKVGDDTIIAYIKNSGNSYALNADQIIYLQQQGVSSTVIATMLNQPKLGLAAAAASTPQRAVSTANTEPVSTVTYVQTVPATTRSEEHTSE